MHTMVNNVPQELFSSVTESERCWKQFLLLTLLNAHCCHYSVWLHAWSSKCNSKNNGWYSHIHQDIIQSTNSSRGQSSNNMACINTSQITCKYWFTYLFSFNNYTGTTTNMKWKVWPQQQQKNSNHHQNTKYSTFHHNNSLVDAGWMQRLCIKEFHQDLIQR